MHRPASTTLRLHIGHSDMEEQHGGGRQSHSRTRSGSSSSVEKPAWRRPDGTTSSQYHGTAGALPSRQELVRNGYTEPGRSPRGAGRVDRCDRSAVPEARNCLAKADGPDCTSHRGRTGMRPTCSECALGVLRTPRERRSERGSIDRCASPGSSGRSCAGRFLVRPTDDDDVQLRLSPNWCQSMPLGLVHTAEKVWAWLSRALLCPLARWLSSRNLLPGYRPTDDDDVQLRLSPN